MWLTSLELAELLRYQGTDAQKRDAARHWTRRRHLVGVRRGTELLFSRRDVEAALTHRSQRRRPAA